MFRQLSAHLPFFVAVSKYLSFSKAAQELSLSQSAISYQIRTLEEKLGFKLFIRGQGSKVALSEKGKLIYVEYSHMEKQFNQLLSDTQIHRSKSNIKVTAPVDFGAKMLTALIPMLERNGLFIDLDLSDHHIELKNSKFDLAIRDNKDETGLEYIELSGQENVLICNPDYAHKNNMVNHKNIKEHHKIVVRNKQHSRSWEGFLKAKNLSFKEWGNKQVIANSFGILEATIAGVGLAILPRYFVQHAIESKLLIEIETPVNALPRTKFFIAFQPSTVANRWALELKETFETHILS
ncbi:MAG: hypothetical protein BM565_13925 [Gammaproteobacteria bacterium MedPE]|nr:MAG: hypothetical protein BM565_13925 [Gammaproteobacteria bacterium MedPE]